MEWLKSYNTSGGRLKPSIDTYKARVKAGGEKAKAYLRNISLMSQGFEHPEHVEWLADYIDQYYGHYTGFDGYINWIRQHANLMRSDLYDKIKEAVYEITDPDELLEALEEILNLGLLTDVMPEAA